MTNDPIVAWLIALAVCTVYGWVMYRRGIARGAQTTATYMVKSIVDSGRMSEKQIAHACQTYWNKLQSQDSADDEES